MVRFSKRGLLLVDVYQAPARIERRSPYPNREAYGYRQRDKKRAKELEASAASGVAAPPSEEWGYTGKFKYLAKPPRRRRTQPRSK